MSDMRGQPYPDSTPATYAISLEGTQLMVAIRDGVLAALRQDRIEQATAKFEAEATRAEEHARWLARETEWLQRLEIKDLA